MRNTTAVPTETTATPTDLTSTGSPAARQRIRGMNEAWRWVVAGVLLIVAIGAQLTIDVWSGSGAISSDANASGIGNYWLQLVLIASGLALVIGGIVKSRRH